MALFEKKIIVKNEIDYDKLATAIEKAHNHIKEQEEIEKCNKQKLLDNNWRETLHYKEYPETKNIFLKAIQRIRNIIVVFFFVIFLKKKNVKDDKTTFVLMRIAVSFLFGIIKWILYVISIYLLFSAFFNNERIIQPLYIEISILPFLFARLLRVASFEIEKMKDKQNLIGILSALSAFLALAVAVISLIVAVTK